MATACHPGRGASKPMTTLQRLRALATGTLLALVSAVAALPGWAGDPLPSWRNTPAKRAILTYVGKVTQPGSADFVPAPERIAVFDNDGTLWPENPLPFQLAFAIDRLREDTGMAGAPRDVDTRQRTRARLERSLDPAELAAALERGAELTIDEAADLAHAELGKVE